ncbi:MAG: hypothetical protein ACRYF3_10550 [Janthinobacterium lividum]
MAYTPPSTTTATQVSKPAEVTYEQKNGDGSLATPGNETWTPDGPGSPFTPPKVAKVETEGRAPEKVNTEVLRKFAQNMRDLIDPMKAMNVRLLDAQVPAGAFPHAVKLRYDVAGSVPASDANTSSVGATWHFLNTAIDKMTNIAEQSEAMAKLYEQTEDQSKLGAEKMQDALSSIESSATSATSSS